VAYTGTQAIAHESECLSRRAALIAVKSDEKKHKRLAAVFGAPALIEQPALPERRWHCIVRRRHLAQETHDTATRLHYLYAPIPRAHTTYPPSNASSIAHLSSIEHCTY
jgi:hypothetical protein